jgi:hypothetical protein
VTQEQLIVLGFVAAAYVAGWITAAVLGALHRRPVRAASEEAAPAPARPLAEEVGHALSDDAANESMLSVFQKSAGVELSDRELDLADWGFTYGVAWEQARRQDRGEAPDAVAAEALQAADEVFRAYTAEAGPNQQIEVRSLREHAPEGRRAD